MITILAAISSISLFAEKEWVNVFPPLDQYEDNMGLYCFDDLNCISLGEVFDVRYTKKTNDGGKSWYIFSEVDLSDRESRNLNPTRTYISDSNNLYTIYYSRVFIDQSSDGGKSFFETTFDELSDEKDTGLDELRMFNNNIGAVHSMSRILITKDNWKTYEKAKLPQNQYYLARSFYFLDSTNIVFYNQNIYFKDDVYNVQFVKYDVLTEEWSLYSSIEKREPNTGYPRLFCLDVVNDSVIYAGGHQGIEKSQVLDIVWKSTDKGITWKRVLSSINGLPPYGGIESISFRNENHGIACNKYGDFYETTDGGESWYHYPIREELRASNTSLAWAGDTPLFAANRKGIFRLETKSSVTEVSNAENIKVRKSDNSLDIAINDESFTDYNFHFYNSSGQVVNTSSVKSSMGYIFQTVPLPDMINGVYYYVISSNNTVYNGKLILIK
ncbi:MAG: hypothetical protein CVV25_12825 [Ignavibacteriae bacterium HGW-Ignavibacteriae-4]|nr:MAG: hypothetical protein CVV25_12825 [Ignavibacteriae bacterium HGW-Ignavibacteriae-4]